MTHAAGTRSGCEFFKEGVSLLPVNAGVGDALAVDKRLAGNELLRARDQVALKHNADDIAIAGGHLCGDIAANDRLAEVVFITVGVAAVDHDAGLEAGFFHFLGSFGDAVGGVVDHFAAAAQDDVAFRDCPW